MASESARLELRRDIVTRLKLIMVRSETLRTTLDATALASLAAEIDRLVVHLEDAWFDPDIAALVRVRARTIELLAHLGVADVEAS